MSVFGFIMTVLILYAVIGLFTVFMTQLIIRFMQKGLLYSADREISVMVGTFWPVAVPVSIVILGVFKAYDFCLTASSDVYDMFKKDK